MVGGVPNIKGAIKATRQSAKRTQRNLATKTRLKTLFKKGKTAGDPAQASSVESAFDKAAQKGIIHPNKAARKKARLVKAIRKAAQAPEATAAKSRGRSGKAK